MKSPPQRRQLTGPRLAFVKTLNAELAKFNEFFMNSEEEFVMRERRLSGEYRRVLNKEGEKADEYTVDAHKKMCRAYADVPAMMTFGRKSVADAYPHAHRGSRAHAHTHDMSETARVQKSERAARDCRGLVSASRRVAARTSSAS